MRISFFLLIFFTAQTGALIADSEVKDPTHTQIQVCENPKTGRVYVCVVSSDQEKGKNIFGENQKRSSRPDYRMLDYRIKAKDVSYDGPSSDRSKVYLLAGTLAATGVLAGTLLPVSAATGAAAGGSGLGYGAAGAGLAAGVVSSSIIASRPNPEKDNYTHESSAKVIKPLPITVEK